MKISKTRLGKLALASAAYVTVTLLNLGVVEYVYLHGKFQPIGVLRHVFDQIIPWRVLPLFVAAQFVLGLVVLKVFAASSVPKS